MFWMFLSGWVIFLAGFAFGVTWAALREEGDSQADSNSGEQSDLTATMHQR